MKKILLAVLAVLLLCGVASFGYMISYLKLIADPTLAAVSTGSAVEISAGEADAEQDDSVGTSAAEPDDASEPDDAVPAGGLEEEEKQPPEEQPPEKLPEKPSEEPADVPEGDKYIALTFDDGPTGGAGGYTSRLLDGLKARGAHATFFLCGYRVKSFPSIMSRYLAEGHEIGNHTMDHKKLTTETTDGGLRQVGDNNTLIASYTGQAPTLMRPTGGAYDANVISAMKQLNMPIILWTVDTRDWKDRDAEIVRSRIVDGAQDGAIVLEHDLYETTIDGVLAAIDDLQAQGYAFVTVSELAEIKGVTLEPGGVYSGFTG